MKSISYNTCTGKIYDLRPLKTLTVFDVIMSGTSFSQKNPIFSFHLPSGQHKRLPEIKINLMSPN